MKQPEEEREAFQYAVCAALAEHYLRGVDELASAKAERCPHYEGHTS